MFCERDLDKSKEQENWTPSWPHFVEMFIQNAINYTCLINTI